MTQRAADSLRYDQLFAGNNPAIRAGTQARLRDLRVGIVGVGGVGTHLAQILAQLGIGTLVVIDPQRLELENFNRIVAMSQTDMGLYKASFLAHSLERRLHLKIRPVVGAVESPHVHTALRNVDVIYCTSNTISSRLATARLANKNHMPLISAGVTDAST
jgi:molybdopterin-synthase adenylyltransferase